MLTEVKNQFKVTLLATKYAIMKESLNKASFLMKVVFMILNNATFIVQWIILFAIRDNIGGYTFQQVLLLWGVTAGVYGISHFFFKNAYNLSDKINSGKLDSYLVQPKNVLISAITSDIETPALGDLLYGFIVLFIYGISLQVLLLFLLFIITGALILTSMTVIVNSLSFWFQKSDMIAETTTSMMTNFATYPEGIFGGAVKVLLFTMIPVGFTVYFPVRVITEFNIFQLVIVLAVTMITIALAFIIFYKGLKRYSSSNLMSARI